MQGAKAGDQIVLYAYTGIWWVQPYANQPLTKILPDGTWKNSAHLGTKYAAVLVDSKYLPLSQMSELPNIGNGVIAVAVANGTGTAPAQKMKELHFSGYDWLVRATESDRGGEPNNYDPENAWVDKSGFLHLSVGERNGNWSCAEISLTRSLGFGTYRFVVQDTAQLPPSAVVTLFTFDDIRSEDNRNELDIELSRWSDPTNKNAQFVVQPYYVAENVARFGVPPGVITYSFRWQPGKVTFKSVRGTNPDSGAKPISEHVFTSDIPIPANETARMDIYDFHHLVNHTHQPSEVVIEKFEYFP